MGEGGGGMDRPETLCGIKYVKAQEPVNFHAVFKTTAKICLIKSVNSDLLWALDRT